MIQVVFAIIITVLIIWHTNTIENFTSAYSYTEPSPPVLYTKEPKFEAIGIPFPSNLHLTLDKISFTKTFSLQNQIIAELERSLTERYKTNVQVHGKHKLRNIYWKGRDIIFETTIIKDSVQIHVKVYCIITDNRIIIRSVIPADPNYKFTFGTLTGMVPDGHLIQQRSFKVPMLFLRKTTLT